MHKSHTPPQHLTYLPSAPGTQQSESLIHEEVLVVVVVVVEVVVLVVVVVDVVGIEQQHS
jgi:hypothetical protein